MKPGHWLAVLLATLAISSGAFAQRTIDPRTIERAASQVQEPQIASQPKQSPITTTAVLSANALWAPAGVDLRTGDQLQIIAQGRWAAINPRQLATNAVSFTGPDGYPQTAGIKGLLLESANRGALIGRIGENGTPFLIGASFQGAAQNNGALFVAMNEVPGQFEDNTGRVSISISVTPAPPPPPVAEAPVPAPERPATDATRPETPRSAPSDGGGAPDIPLVVIIAAALGGLVALALLTSALFGPRPRGRGGRDSSEPNAAPAISARVATDGVRSEMLSISMRSGS